MSSGTGAALVIFRLSLFNSNTPTSSQPDSVPSARLARLAQLGTELHANSTETAVWLALEQTLADFFGYSLFTVLAFSKQGGVTRLYSTNTGLHPLEIRNESPTADYDRDNVGTPPPPPCRAVWVQQVLDGNIWRGYVPEDLKAAFENWEQLWQVGLGSVLSILVRMNVYLLEAELVSYCAATYLHLKSLDLTILIDIKARL
jgi:hypothetical protein